MSAPQVSSPAAPDSNINNNGALGTDATSSSLSEPLDLVQLCLDERVVVKLRGDRELEGRLHAYDSHCNVVLGNVVESVYVVEEVGDEDVVKVIKNEIEMLFVRGDSVVLIAPVEK